MDKSIYYSLLISFIIISSCSSNDSKSTSFEFENSFQLLSITPDSCKARNLEKRNFTVKIPDTFKKYNENVPDNIHYISIEKRDEEGNELLQISEAEIDLKIYSKLLDTKVEAKNTYTVLFDAYKPIIDKFILEKGMKKLLNNFCSYSSIHVYSKKPNDQIKINNLPANYSEVIVHYESRDGKQVWQQYSYLIVPNQDNLKKSLTAAYVKEVYDMRQGIGKTNFLESESFKVISSIQFTN